MAAPVGLLARVALAIIPELKDILKFLLLALLLPLTFLILLFAGPVVVHERIPLASPSQVQIYVDAAQKASVGGVSVDWQTLLAIDAVRLKQDFSKANPAEAEALAKQFIEQITETVIDENGEEKTVTRYRLKSLDEVIDELGFSQKEAQKVRNYLTIDLSVLRDVGTGVPPGWMPVEGLLKWPVPGVYTVTSGFGPRVDPVEGLDGFHAGMDIGAATGTPVVAVADGMVVVAGWAGGYGKAVFLQHAGGLETRYAHLSVFTVRRGQQVRAGDVIGYVGSTGKSTGPHLHFEIRRNGRPINPIEFYNKTGS
jgi:murein DD-endopeptidase MepM/ murein hydrolase activator NlpD